MIPSIIKRIKEYTTGKLEEYYKDIEYPPPPPKAESLSDRQLLEEIYKILIRIKF